MFINMIEYCVYGYSATTQKNCITKATVNKIFQGFNNLNECRKTLDSICDFLDKDNYLVIKTENGKPTEVSGVYFVFDDEAFMDVAEHDFREIASIAFGVDLI